MKLKLGLATFFLIIVLSLVAGLFLGFLWSMTLSLATSTGIIVYLLVKEDEEAAAPAQQEEPAPPEEPEEKE